MAVEWFTRAEFEQVLPDAVLIGVVGHQLVYSEATSHPMVEIRVHSSMNVRTGLSDDAGKNSIRMYAFRKDLSRSLGKDGTEYTTRVKGWQGRLREKLCVLRARVRPCPNCWGVAVVRVVKKDGPNKGRQFWACQDGGCWGGWADE